MKPTGSEFGRLPLLCSSQQNMLSELLVSSPGVIYIVGGFLRDACLGYGPGSDIDLVVPKVTNNQSYLTMAKRRGWQGFLLDKSRSFIRLLSESNSLNRGAARLTIDLVPLAENGIEADLAKRECTANAMALRILEVGDCWVAGTWLDPFGGRKDLSDRKLRPVALDNLLTDPLRMLRMFRLGHTRDLMLEEEVLHFIKYHYREINKVNPVRLHEEVWRLLAFCYRPVSHALQQLAESGLLAQVLPYLPGRSTDNNLRLSPSQFLALMDQIQVLSCHRPTEASFWWLQYSVTKSLTAELQTAVEGALVAGISRRQWWIFLGYIVGRIFAGELGDTGSLLETENFQGKVHLERYMQVSGLSRIQNRHSQAFLAGCRLLLIHIVRQESELIDRKFLHRLIMQVGWTKEISVLIDIISILDAVADFVSLKGSGTNDRFPEICQGILDVLSETGLGRPVPLVSGTDLQRWFGLPPGPQIGRLLNILLEAQAEQVVSTPDEARRFIEETL